jgi:hypothetical protein
MHHREDHLRIGTDAKWCCSYGGGLGVLRRAGVGAASGNRFCRSETNRRMLKPLFFHTANPRHRGIATERRALRGEQMKKLGGGRVRVVPYTR